MTTGVPKSLRFCLLFANVFFLLEVCRGEEPSEPSRTQLLREMQVAGPTLDHIGRLFRSREMIGNAAARQAILKVCAAGLIRMNRLADYRNQIRPELEDAETFERSFVVPCSACGGTGKSSVPCKECGGTGTCPAKNCVGGRIPVSGFSQSRVPSGRTLGGSAEAGGYRKCLVCNGTGKCPKCQGTGRIEVNCTVCEGQGKVWDAAPAAAIFDRLLADALRLLPPEVPVAPPPPAGSGRSSETNQETQTGDGPFSDAKVWYYAGLIVLAAIGVAGLRLIRVSHS